MPLRHLRFIHWPISAKLTAIFLLAVVLPALLILVPYSSQRHSTLLRERRTDRLEALGPLESERTAQAFQSLVNSLGGLISPPTTVQQIEEYLLNAPAAPDDERARLDRALGALLLPIQSSAPSISRIRVWGASGQLLQDLTGQANALSNTPANRLMGERQLGFRATVGEIYPDADDNPSLDVIFAFRAENGDPVGFIVFTHDLRRAPDDPALPDWYALLREYPQTDYVTGVFALNVEGRLIAPAEHLDLFYDASVSQGFQAARRGETGVSEYYSPLMRAEVLGYHTIVSYPDGPPITLLVETPLNAIRREAREEELLTLALVGAGVLILGLLAIAVGTRLITRPITGLTEAARQMAGGQFDIRLARLAREDEIGVLNNTLSEAAARLFAVISDLEARVSERTRNLETVLEIGRSLASIRDPDALLENVVNLIRDQFESIYHAQVFLIDPKTRRANLRASTGDAGRLLLQRGHYLDVGSQSVIGSVTANGHTVIALDTSNNPIHQRNEFLPDTRAEMALPLRTGSQIIGALDLQSQQPDAFSEQDVELFQGMADQLAIAIENAALFEESTVRFQEIERLNRSLRETVWREVEQHRAPQGLRAASGAPGVEGWTALQLEAVRTGQIVERTEGGMVTFAVPVLFRDQVLGAVEWQVPPSRYTPDTRQTALELSTRLAITAENIRLFEQSRRAAQRELLVNQISSKLIGTADIDQILQTAVQELGLALRNPKTAIRLNAPSGTPPAPETKDGDSA